MKIDFPEKHHSHRFATPALPAGYLLRHINN